MKCKECGKIRFFFLDTIHHDTTATTTAAMTTTIEQTKTVFMDFNSFLKDAKILDTAISFVLAGATLDTSRSLVNNAIMPLVFALREMKAPVIGYEALANSAILWVITLWIAFVVIRVFSLTARPVQMVQTIN